MEVKNGPIERIFRTIGFALVFVPTFIFFLDYVSAFNIAFISNILNPVINFITINLTVSATVLHFAFILGFFILIWTQNRSVLIRVIASIIGIFTVLALQYKGNFDLLPFTIPNISFINDLIDLAYSKINRLEIAAIILSLFLVHLILAYKKPERISSRVVSSGVLLLILAVFAFYLPTIITVTWTSTTVYVLLQNFLYTLAFLAMSLGSLFGIIGIFRK